MAKPRLAVVKFASCDGCQLTLLDCEDELLAVAGAVDIANFPEASSDMRPGPYDVTLVEGSITNDHDAARLRQLRDESGVLVSLGACATAGGIQALRNFADASEYVRVVYARPDYIHTLATSTPVSAHVHVDYELRGCPIDKGQLLELISALLAGRRPVLPTHSVCVDCKLAGRVCVMVAHGTPCLGPVTQAGCHSLCPHYHRGCYGCFGPAEMTNTSALAAKWAALGASRRDIHRAFRTFNAAAEPFRQEADAHG